MARRVGGSHVAPSTRSGPLAEHVDETVFEWLKRQQNPAKPDTPAVLAMATATAKKKAADLLEQGDGEIPEGT